MSTFLKIHNLIIFKRNVELFHSENEGKIYFEAIYLILLKMVQNVYIIRLILFDQYHFIVFN